MMIPTIIIDEHNEAFCAWRLFVERGAIEPTGNYLLHIDHHDDMECGGYDWDFNKPIASLDSARNFLDRCLGIADFIAPALWYQTFSTVHIIKNLVPKALNVERRFVRLDGDQVLLFGSYIPFIHAPEKDNPDSRYHFFDRIDGGLNDDDQFPSEGVVLDVDLDYFCWDNSLKSAPPKRMEITRSAFDEYMSDRNHPFRIVPRKFFVPQEIDGRYWLVYEEHSARNKLPTEERIIKRIDRLINYLLDRSIKPKAIDICRSSYSGYLPKERAAFVEENFVSRLASAFELKFI